MLERSVAIVLLIFSQINISRSGKSVWYRLLLFSLYFFPIALLTRGYLYYSMLYLFFFFNSVCSTDKDVVYLFKREREREMINTISTGKILLDWAPFDFLSLHYYMYMYVQTPHPQHVHVLLHVYKQLYQHIHTVLYVLNNYI